MLDPAVGRSKQGRPRCAGDIQPFMQQQKGNSPLGLRPVLFVVGAFLTILGVAMLVPAAVDLAGGDPDWVSFFVSGALTVLVGLLLTFANFDRNITLSRHQAFLLTVLSWLGVTAFSAMPFHLSRFRMSYTDAFFEAISGLTTTGATVITGLDLAPPGILLWRSLLHWLGGIGIVVMAISLLPFLRVGGMQLFKMESSDTGDKVLGKVSQLGAALVLIYIALTTLCTVFYLLGGMTLFEAVNHAMSTLSTGGYSTSDSSIAHFNSHFINWVAIVFMICGGVPFTLFIRMGRGGVRVLFSDLQVRGFLGFLILTSVILTVWMMLTGKDDLFDTFSHVMFSVVSVVTTTGFASADYTQWGNLAVASFFALLFVGGCTGSTAGGIKIFRFHIAWKLFVSHIHRLISPNAVEVQRYGDRRITEDVAASVLLFFFIYIATVGGITLFLAAVGLDWVTAISGAATAVGNVGPGLGDIIGPAGNFQPLPDAAKWALSVGMLLGRLEFFSVLVLLFWRFWRD
ncbi:TrkH family potassium uptake protein [Haematospirillum sp. H1815]|uniref:TrkH family potassium uptake protein n=1 Tax=Haematospirillum sp. H1815 TaxID=2723108 RepID=UPI001FD74E8D|nr:TrkH family potassium uptake protein [Haematospirillum sp. H1815]